LKDTYQVWQSLPKLTKDGQVIEETTEPEGSAATQGTTGSKAAKGKKGKASRKDEE